MRYLRKFALTLFVWSSIGGIVTAQAYEPPAGIPEPTFGIDETRPAHPPQWPATERQGYYFVDNTHPNATDNNNEFGYPDKPRATLPIDIGVWPAGTYVEVHGGPYYVSRNQWRVYTNGTAENPTWLVGDESSKPIFRFEFIIEDTSHFIVEHLKFDTHLRWIRATGQSDHLVIRYCELTGDTNAVARASMIGVSGDPGKRSSDVLVYRNNIHDSGDTSGVNEVDINGITNPAYIDRLWILENEIYRVGGDSVRVGQNQGRMPEPSALPHFTYLGRNHFYGNGENAIDVKHATDVIISENQLHGISNVVSSSGEAVVIHENAERVWVIGNTVYDAEIGLINTSGTDVWFIANEIYDIHAQGGFDPESNYGRGVAIHFRGISSGGVVNNTIHDYDKGVQISSGSSFQVVNNIFSSRSEQSSYDIMFSNSSLVGATTLQNNNLFTDFRSKVGSTSYWSLAQFRGATGYETDGIIGSPKFINAAQNNFSILDDSDAIDSGMDSDIYDVFQSLYGLSIRKDFSGNNRPLFQGWDMGSREFVGGLVPKSPENLQAFGD